MIPLRQLMKQYQARIDASARGDRVLRESSTMRAADEVWSDVASSRGLGFRSSEAGPMIHGDLTSGGALEIGLYEAKHTEVYCTVATVRGSEERVLAGELSCRPHDMGTRVMRMVVRQPALGADVLARYFVRSRPIDLAPKLFGTRAEEMLGELADRAPRLYWSAGTTTLVLEGVELVHERLERLIEALTDIDAAGHGA